MNKDKNDDHISNKNETPVVDSNNNKINKKIVNPISRIITKINENRKESSKNYFSSISLSILVSIFSLSFYTGSSFYTISYLLEDFDLFLIVVIPLAIVGIIVFSLLPVNIINRIKFLTFPFITIGYLLVLFASNNALLTYLGYIFIGVGYGLGLGTILLVYLYKFSMSEKILFVLLSLFFIYTYSFIVNAKLSAFYVYTIFPIIIAHLGLIGFIIIKTIKEKEKEKEKENETNKVNARITVESMVLLSVFLVVFLLNKGFISSIELQIHGGFSVNQLFYSKHYYFGFILSILIVLFIFQFTKKPFLYIIVTYVIITVVAYELGILWQLFSNRGDNISYWLVFVDLFLGISSSFGLICCFLFAGKVVNIKIDRISMVPWLLIICSYYVGSYFIGIYLYNFDMDILFTTMLVFIIICGLILLLLKYLGFFDPKFTKETPVNDIMRNQTKYRLINPKEVLSAKEYAVFELLLEGLTLRQIAGELSQKFDTVNFHYKNIYRKLEVNSKIELLLRYGKNILD